METVETEEPGTLAPGGIRLKTGNSSESPGQVQFFWRFYPHLFLRRPSPGERDPSRDSKVWGHHHVLKRRGLSTVQQPLPLLQVCFLLMLLLMVGTNFVDNPKKDQNVM
ncbi:hypothetical protein Csal_3319 [Chromohalobacter israelensis DSM 3043]|uniref:Uncharacterized protein n=1 Tax=Chromohalobacter israelensis (strain ATCC BAA-138 / DSM 3043 / CIP 106854 / NCIMB 13768 / 1H11) TaxID=290398 RepID=Q1QS95_CHRI1|nr:hypothetical protein Csal_3319 [Chromohalobacter salexigens DSM 3043]